MTAETDVKQRLAALRRVLADATKKCPAALHTDMESLEVACGACGVLGDAGQIARFRGFRQECNHKRFSYSYITKNLYCHSCPALSDDLPDLRWRRAGWQVRAGGLEDALAGLPRPEASVMLDSLKHVPSEQPGYMPDRDEILAEGLRLICEVAGLKVPPACAS